MSETERFSLKDFLFNKEKVEKVADEIVAVYPKFPAKNFIKKVLDKFPELELMERIYWMRDRLKEFLPDNYQEATKILLDSLPEPCDPTLSDDDFGDFIYSPYGYFVSEFGCSKADVGFSLAALREMTTRFSVEGPIRFFLNKFPEETMLALNEWKKDKHYHVRRLASEGTRPKLPWAKKIDIPHHEPLAILDALHADQTRFVTRSVANHLNDISKIDPTLVIQTLKRWQKAGEQESKELDFITRHSLRTLVKDGHAGALGLLGYSAKDIKVSNFEVLTPRVRIGESLEFTFTIESTSKTSQNLMIDYLLYFNKANSELAAKTHKLAKKTLLAGESLTLTKNHLLRVMTTRKLYPGVHKVELQINGQRFGDYSFTLTD